MGHGMPTFISDQSSLTTHILTTDSALQRLLPNPPNPRRGEFKQVARRIAKIDAASALRPVQDFLDHDLLRFQTLNPTIDVTFPHAKRQMTRTERSMTGKLFRRLPANQRIEQQQHPLPAMHEN